MDAGFVSGINDHTATNAIDAISARPKKAVLLPKWSVR